MSHELFAQQIIRLHVHHGFEDVLSYPPVILVQLLDQILYVLSLGGICRGAGVFHHWQFRLPGETLQQIFIRVGEGPDEVKLPLKIRLIGDHGADLPPEKYVQKKSFDDVILIVSQGQFSASVLPGQFKELPAAQPGAKKTGAGLAVVIAVRQEADVRIFDSVRNPFFFEVVLQHLYRLPVRPLESQVHIDGENEFRPGHEKKGARDQLKQGQAVRPARNPHQYTVAFREHPVLENGLLESFPEVKVKFAHFLRAATKNFIGIRINTDSYWQQI